MISNENVVWICNPKRGWSGVSIEDTVRSFGLDNQIITNVVASLNTILDEDVVTLAVEVDILFDTQVVHSMNCRTTIE